MIGRETTHQRLQSSSEDPQPLRSRDRNARVTMGITQQSNITSPLILLSVMDLLTVLQLDLP